MGIVYIAKLFSGVVVSGELNNGWRGPEVASVNRIKCQRPSCGPQRA